MKKRLSYLLAILLLLCFMPRGSQAQVSSDPYVPCQEMPHLIENFNADSWAIVRFYNTSFYGTRNGGYGGNQEGGAPEKSHRLDELYHEYLHKLEEVDFKSLPQECKVD